MYRIFVEQLSGRRFIEDLDVVRVKLAIINSKMGETGELSTDYFFKMIGIKPLIPDVTYTVLKGVMFQFYPSNIGGVDVISIGIDRIEEEV